MRGVPGGGDKLFLRVPTRIFLGAHRLRGAGRHGRETGCAVEGTCRRGVRRRSGAFTKVLRRQGAGRDPCRPMAATVEAAGECVSTLAAVERLANRRGNDHPLFGSPPFAFATSVAGAGMTVRGRSGAHIGRAVGIAEGAVEELEGDIAPRKDGSSQ